MRTRSEAKATSEPKEPEGQTQWAPPTMSIMVTYPEQVFSPISFNTFRIGGMSLTDFVPRGSTPRETYERLWAELEKIATVQFDEALEKYLERVEKAATRVNRKR